MNPFLDKASAFVHCEQTLEQIKLSVFKVVAHSLVSSITKHWIIGVFARTHKLIFVGEYMVSIVTILQRSFLFI